MVFADKVTARLSFNGTYKGEFMGKTPTGKPVHFFAIDILHTGMEKSLRIGT
ncbi:SnoaL-like polyketide cyclase [Neobacillus bataviensis]|uniref:SnoaL-like polyketide cyclase n=1 Tax=Neobacillus bataviensis TaxID=220685 RepID=A0A561DDF0_9BACI|nr:SnoaL-like polyketide cyclase [Neobacillus bataviensis]